MPATKQPFYLAGELTTTDQVLDVKDKYSGEDFAKVCLANDSHIDNAITAAEQSRGALANMLPYQRKKILQDCVQAIRGRQQDLAHTLCREAGKPIKDSEGEVKRLIETFDYAAEEAIRIGGKVIPLAISARAAGYEGHWSRFPVGVCSFIIPFNFPLNLAAHKIAPAIAAGCPFILKPASQTPLSALQLGEILAETDLPSNSFSILPCRQAEAGRFIHDTRIRFLSFTGSAKVGWKLKAKAGKKKVALELGGNAYCVVDADADLEDTVERVIKGAFYQSGQSCISVQNLLIHEHAYNEFVAALVHETERLSVGNPMDKNTFIGPLISEDAAKRLETWIHAACDSGASLLCGGKREGSMLRPTVLAHVPEDCDIVAKEAFGPVVTVSKFADFEKALAKVNTSNYGLQTGVFTRDLYKARLAYKSLEVGGVIIGDVPSWRVDHMPYGGVKDSGLGREGISYAIEEMTERRLFVVRDP